MNDNKLINYYQENFNKYGVHENSLGWTKGKQFIRFYELTKRFSLEGATLLDVGCGFGDINDYFQKNEIHLKNYTGIDILKDFIDTAAKKHQADNTHFILGNYLQTPFDEIDYITGSGIFGHKLFEADKEQYEYIEHVFAKSFSEVSQAISFDFISSKTEYKTGENDFHASPSAILELAYKFSRNVVLDNTAMPFEFTVTVFKEQSFLKERTVFNKFLNDQSLKFQKGQL